MYRGVCIGSCLAFTILDGDTGKITDVNRFLIDLLGYGREAFLGKKLWELGFLKYIAATKLAYENLQKTGYVRYEDLPLEWRLNSSAICI